MNLSIIVPFHKRLDHLASCLAALNPLSDGCEIIVVADGAPFDCRPLAAEWGASVIDIPGPSGPAVARNRGAAVAKGRVLVFVDADVVVGPDTMQHLARLMEQRPGLAAVFGAYDEDPEEPHFISQYKNLAHSYIHQESSSEAHTFWAGFGAIRTDAFDAVGGFDERFARPSVEDIELGYRLSAAGHRVRLDRELRVRHLKRWTFRSLLVSDIRDRGIPWTQLILRSGRVHNDLNLRNAYRVSVGLSYLLVMALILLPFDGRALVPAIAAAGVLYGLNWKFYSFFRQRRGVWFAVRVVPLHLLYHLYNGVSFSVGSLLFFVQRWTGIRLPGAVPLSPWTGRSGATRNDGDAVPAGGALPTAAEPVDPP